MKKLSVFELALISALVALTIVVKLPFAAIPGIEFTTPLFVAVAILLRRDLSLFYVVVFLLVDSLLLGKGNMTFIGINCVMWLCIYTLCQVVKVVKWQQLRVALTFIVGVVVVLLQTAIWFYAFPLATGTSLLPFSALLLAWGADFATGHPVVAGIFAVVAYFSLVGVTQTYRLKRVFDN